MLYLLAHVAFTRRTTGSVDLGGLVVALVLLPLAWAGSSLPALATLGLLTAVVVGLVAFETVRHADDRHQARHAVNAPTTP